jgi:hypothetical protein
LGRSGVARANTAVGVSPETFLLLLLQEEDAIVVGLTPATPYPALAQQQQLTFTRVPSAWGGAEAAAALEAALAEEHLRHPAKPTGQGPPAESVAAAAGPRRAPAGLGGSSALPVIAESSVVSLPPPRSLKFDPLRKVSEAAQSGADVSRDGWGARADPDTLDASAN